MRAFFHHGQMCHTPQQYMRYGKFIPVKDLPERSQKLLGALAARGIRVDEPEAYGTAPALGVHTAGYLTFLETAWARWSELPDHGPEVWPNTFPYWSGRPDEAARPPCPATGLVGQTGWYLGDLSVPMGPMSWTSILRSCETAVSGAAALMEGASAVYALCRPSGHHARADRATGFCYLNNTAVAAQCLRRRFGKIAIIDVDAHHGDGTQQIFYGRPDILTVSIHADPINYYPFFTGFAHETGFGPGEGYNLNLPLAPGSGGEAMASALTKACRRAQDFGAEAIVLALGYDAHEADPIGVLKLQTRDFGAIGRQIQSLGLPTLIVQEGGYAIEIIGDCLGAFFDGFGGF